MNFAATIKSLGLPDEVEDEFEALCAIYAEEEVRVSPERSPPRLVVAVKLVPHTGGGTDQALVSCTLQMTVGEGYPESASPTLALAETKGIGDDDVKVIVEKLSREAANFFGEPVLPMLCNSCQEILTGMNHAVCSICLESVGKKGALPGFRTPLCSHTFHYACISEWYLRKAVAVATGDFSTKEEDLQVFEDTLASIFAEISRQTCSHQKLSKNLKDTVRALKYTTRVCTEWSKLNRTKTQEEAIKMAADMHKKGELENAFESLKIESKLVKQSLEKLQWKSKEVSRQRDSIILAKEKIQDYSFGNKFNLPCPVCRTVIPFEGVVEDILREHRGHPLYRGITASNSEHLVGQDDASVQSLEPKLRNFCLDVQAHQEKLKARLKVHENQ